MKKIAITIVLLLMTLPIFSQKITITTTQFDIRGSTGTEMTIVWEVYQDSLVMTYTDKKTIKMMNRLNQPTEHIIPYKLTKDSTGTYKYQDDKMRILVMPMHNSVRMSTKDDFTNTSTDVLYYNL